MNKNFQILMKTKKKNPSKLKMKKFIPRHIMIKLLKTSDKDKIWNAARDRKACIEEQSKGQEISWRKQQKWEDSEATS